MGSLKTNVLRAGCTIAAGVALCSAAHAAPVLGVPTTSVASPQKLGTTVVITANATDIDPGTISYRFEIGAAGSAVNSMVRDFSVDKSFTFTPTRQEGNFQFVVTARNNSTGKTTTNKVALFRFTSLVVNGAPAITPTANPLVALFSTPPCPAGALTTRASILLSGSTSPSYTNWVTCQAGRNVNFVIAGMRAQSVYTIGSQTFNGSTISSGSTLDFVTGTPPVSFPAIAVTVPSGPTDNKSERFMLMSTINPQPPMAVDLSGKPVWYYQDPTGITPTITRPVLGGKILILANGANSIGSAVTTTQILREIDLAGNVIRETNASRVDEQVSALSGIPSSCVLGGTECLVGSFHHEALRLPNGHTLVLADEEKIFTDGTQGSSSATPVDIIGDVIIDLDANFQVVGYWRAFDHLDANRAAVLGETCVNNQGGCPPVTLVSGKAKDWLHGNALFYSPTDGSILFSMRHQDWVVKIDYGNGSGTGNILWRLGAGGDFTMNSSDPYPWFSHQHDPGFLQGGTSLIEMFDNGNTRVAPPPVGLGSGNSRGYVLSLNEASKVATPVLMADLGVYSLALGTSQQLSNGDYQFEAGYINFAAPYSQAIEVHPDSSLGFTTQSMGTLVYRNIRMVSLYIPSAKD